MRESGDISGNMLGIWGMALIAGAIATVMSVMFGGLSWTGAVFVGIVLFLVLGALLHALLLQPLSAPGSVAPVSRVAAATPDAVAPADDAPVVTAKAVPVAAPAVAALADLPAVAPDGKPALYDAPQGGVPDDLKQIKGVGPKMEAMLNRMGIWHFAQVASWRAEEVAWVDANLEGFKGRVTRDDWVSQARILAVGGETAFSKQVEGGGVY